MDNQMRGMVAHRDAALGRLARADAVCEHDVAQNDLAIPRIDGDGVEQIGLDHRKGQHVGRLVLVPILPVERLDLFVGGQPHRQLDHRRVAPGPSGKGRARDRRNRGGVGQHLPVAVFPRRIGPG